MSGDGDSVGAGKRMPDTFKPLFNRHLLKSRMAGFDPALSDEQTRIVADWVRAANDPAFRQEKEIEHGRR